MKKKSIIRLGVNIDHAATLRQVRGGKTAYPNLVQIAELALAGGADQITIHLREDRRHIQESDLADLSKWGKLPLNLEMAATPAMVRLALKYKPDWVCYVPEKRQELTTEGGLNVAKYRQLIEVQVERLQRIGIEVSMFIDPKIEQVQASFDVGAEAVEFHTGHWVLYTGQKKAKEWARLCKAAEFANELGLGVHAGHGLEPHSTRQIKELPHLAEVNVGHFLICESLRFGLKQSVKELAQILRTS